MKPSKTKGHPAILTLKMTKEDSRIVDWICAKTGERKSSVIRRAIMLYKQNLMNEDEVVKNE